MVTHSRNCGTRTTPTAKSIQRPAESTRRCFGVPKDGWGVVALPRRNTPQRESPAHSPWRRDFFLKPRAASRNRSAPHVRSKASYRPNGSPKKSLPCRLPASLMRIAGCVRAQNRKPALSWPVALASAD
jgi:hypothetical protein